MSAQILAPDPGGALAPRSEPPSFSFVIPAYEAAATIAGSVASALEQTLPAREVVVVDDGSGDDLEGTLAPYADRIVLIRKENGGAASARNAAIGAASGEFLVMQDADDRSDPRRLEALAELATERPDLDLITTDVRFTTGGEPDGTFRDRNPFAVAGQRTAIFWSAFLGGWPGVRLARLREVGGFDETLRTGEDWDCWLRLIFSGSAAGLIALPYYDYTVDSDGLTSARVSSLWDRVTLLEKAAATVELRGDEGGELRRALRHHRGVAVLAEARSEERSRGRAARLALLPGIAPGVRVRCAVSALSRGGTRS